MLEKELFFFSLSFLRVKLLFRAWERCQGPANPWCRLFFPFGSHKGEKKNTIISGISRLKKKASKQGTSPQSSRFGSKTLTFFSSQGDQMKLILAGRPQKFHECLHRPGMDVSSNERSPGDFRRLRLRSVDSQLGKDGEKPES